MATAQLVRVCRSARLSVPAYQFYRGLLLAFLVDGRPPDQAQIRALARQYGLPLAVTLARLVRQDLVQRDTAGNIRAAYPFSGVPTPHRVTLAADHRGARSDHDAMQVYAMCALDALGIPLMLGCAAQIVSQDVLSGEPLRVVVSPAAERAENETRPLPLAAWHATWDPATAVVYARSEDHEREHDTGACVAAGMCCPVTNFFARPASAEAWIAQHPDEVTADGVVLAAREALARAYDLFAGVLERDVPSA